MTYGTVKTVHYTLWHSEQALRVENLYCSNLPPLAQSLSADAMGCFTALSMPLAGIVTCRTVKTVHYIFQKNKKATRVPRFRPDNADK